MSDWEHAPAKINLALHVTGRRDDGYHLLDSLVVFAEVADRIAIEPTDGPSSLCVTGPMARGIPTGPENLVLKAAHLAAPNMGVAITLEKHLPAQAGIGGGSSDAAAVLRALHARHGVALPRLAQVARLGADVPVCLAPRSQRMEGIGERLTPVETVPTLSAVLVNPGVAVPTPAVFGALQRRDNPPLPPMTWQDETGFRDWLGRTRNDLQAPALSIASEIGTALAALEASGASLARMSGSGATCFGLFDRPDDAHAAANSLREDHPDWWIVATRLGAAGGQLTRATT